jgi:hypothetical protein
MSSEDFTIVRGSEKVYTFNQPTAEYIHKLEAIVQSAYELWKVAPYEGRTAARADDLYERFKSVNIIE